MCAVMSDGDVDVADEGTDGDANGNDDDEKRLSRTDRGDSEEAWGSFVAPEQSAVGDMSAAEISEAAAAHRSSCSTCSSAVPLPAAAHARA